MRIKIKEIRQFGKILLLGNGMELRIHDYYIHDVAKWDVTSEIELNYIEYILTPIVLRNLSNQQTARARTSKNMDLVPTSKFDFESVERLKHVDIKDIEPILPDLFEWMEDPNWPIASDLATVLVSFGEIIIPYIKCYLSHPDGQSEYFIYYFVLPILNQGMLKLISEELRRIIDNPTNEEKEYEYDKIALEHLNRII